MPLPAFGKKGTVNLVVETPKGHRNKFQYDYELGRFRLCKMLPAGASFPYDFGFVSGTRADDGDPLDVLILMDEPAFPGCIVEGRLIGVIEAEQEEDGKVVRNDRLVAVAKDSHDYGNLRTLADMNESLLKELEHFFKSYNDADGVEFHVLRTRGSWHARQIVEQAIVTKSTSKKRHPK
jgi:inorganic pyrophosphatase